MAQAATSGNTPSQGLLASCKGKVYLLKNKKWEALFAPIVYRLLLVRQAGNFMLLITTEQPKIVIKAQIQLRFNTIFKTMKSNFFSLLDNGVLLWGFDVMSQPEEAKTFAVVIQNTLISLKESHVGSPSKPALKPTTPSKQALKHEQQDFLNNICLTLSDAISRGNEQFASDLARQLAAQKAAVKIRLDDPEHDKIIKGVKDNKINLKVQVEDKDSSSCNFRIDVAPQVTVNQLKQMVQMKYNFPTEIQHWIIGKRLPKQNESLLDCGIKSTGQTLYLYLKSADASNPDRGPAQAWGGGDERLNANLNRSNSETNVAAAPVYQGHQNVAFNQLRDDRRSLPNMPSGVVREPPPPAVGWTCPLCTYVNAPSRPGCEMCATARPQDYQIPVDYVPGETERRRLEQQQTEEILIFEEEERRKRLEIEERDRNYQQLMSIALQQPLIENQEEFDCPICFDTIVAGEGVVLRECLHTFCKECLSEHIRSSTDAEVQCPYDNGDFACHDVITTQEIQELLDEEEFQKFLQRSLATAENQAANSFHCQTPNCNGWCIYDDEVNDFDCPVCGKRNCLTCKAIHFPVNCKEYQDDLKRNAVNDEAARKTQEYLEQMLRTKDGMHCPVCGIILVKKDGCDWMKCSMCKTEICWAVRGPRWGPGGPGDTTGGCKCRVNNAKCHPQCKNCH